MNTQKFDRTSINMSIIGLSTNYVGGHNFYADVDEQEGVRLVQCATDPGITHLDTVDAYGLGCSEELIGKATKGHRDETVLATKGGILFGEHSSGVSNEPAYLRGALERSLKRPKSIALICITSIAMTEEPRLKMSDRVDSHSKSR